MLGWMTVYYWSRLFHPRNDCDCSHLMPRICSPLKLFWRDLLGRPIVDLLLRLFLLTEAPDRMFYLMHSSRIVTRRRCSTLKSHYVWRMQNVSSTRTTQVYFATWELPSGDILIPEARRLSTEIQGPHEDRQNRSSESDS